MPTLDDAPIVTTLDSEDITGATGGYTPTNGNINREDILQVFDVTTQEPKTITVQKLGEALGLTFLA